MYQLTYYPLYRQGRLATGGGVDDQPAVYLDYMLAIDATEAAMLRKNRELDALTTDQG